MHTSKVIVHHFFATENIFTYWTVDPSGMDCIFVPGETDMESAYIAALVALKNKRRLDYEKLTKCKK